VSSGGAMESDSNEERIRTTKYQSGGGNYLSGRAHLEEKKKCTEVCTNPEEVGKSGGKNAHRVNHVKTEGKTHVMSGLHRKFLSPMNRDSILAKVTLNSK